MEESKTPNLTVMEMKQKRDQLCFGVGHRCFNIEVMKAENIRDNQEILTLNNKIAEVEAKHQEPVKAVEVDEILPADIETPKLV